MPSNGLCIFCGLVTDSSNREKKLFVDFEPPSPLSFCRYKCDRKFGVNVLREMIAPRERFGFIIIGGRRCILGLVYGQVQKVLEGFNVDLPSKHGMGGQSAVRFQRLAEEARHHLKRIVGESAQRRFITSGIPNITGLILAGCAQLKHQLERDDFLGDQLNSLILGIVDISYDGEAGFTEAVKKSRHLLKEVSSIREERALEELFDSAGRGENCAFGIEETMIGWEYRAIIRIYVCRELKLERVVKENGEVIYCGEDEIVEDPIERNGLPDWIVEHYREIGCELTLVGNNTPEGAQLSKAFGGIAARLRIPIEALKIGDDGPLEFDSDSDFDL